MTEKLFWPLICTFVYVMWVKYILKYSKRLAWAFTIAYMIAWHNVYNQKMDTKDSIECIADYQIQEENHKNKNSEALS